jgi:hypothetical protein
MDIETARKNIAMCLGVLEGSDWPWADGLAFTLSRCDDIFKDAEVVCGLLENEPKAPPPQVVLSFESGGELTKVFAEALSRLWAHNGLGHPRTTQLQGFLEKAASLDPGLDIDAVIKSMRGRADAIRREEGIV